MASDAPRPHAFLLRLRPRLVPYRWPLIWATVLIVLGTIVGLAFPLVLGDLLDAAFEVGDRQMLDRVGLVLLALFAVYGLVNFGQSYLMASVSERIIADLRREVFGHLIRQSPGFFARQRVGELSSRLASDAGLVQSILRFGIPELVRQGLFLLGAVALITITDWRLTMVTLVAIPPTVLAGWILGRRVRRISTGIQDRLASAVARAEQVFTQIRVVQGFTREDLESRLFATEVDATRDEGLRRAVARAILTGVVTFTAFGAIGLVMWEGGRLVLEGSLTAGTLFAFLFYAVFIAGAVTSLAGFWSNFQEASGAARRIFEILDRETDLVDPEDPVSLPSPVEGRVEYRGVRFRYAPDLPQVLVDIDLTMEPGETVALVGASGAGKSTLASLLPRFHDVEAGEVLLDGVDVRHVRLAELRGVMGIVPQEPMLFAGTIRENLAYGRPDATSEEIEQASRDAHAHGFIAGFPDGYDEIVGERGVTLSAGQRQRIAIARVMLRSPAVLILDEASSALDAESESLVQAALERLMADRTTLVIAHRLSTVLRADRILVLDQGEIAARGTHEELLGQSGTYQRLYRRQFEEAMASSAVSSG